MITLFTPDIYRCFRLAGGRWAIVAALLCLLGLGKVVAPDQVWAGSVELLTPRAGATIVAVMPEIHVVLRQPEADAESRIRVGKSKTALKPVVVMEDGENRYLHFRLPLVPGKNQFIITPGDQQVELNYQQVKGALIQKPFGKETYRFHLDDKLPEACGGCHELLESTNLDKMGLLKGLTSCGACHKNFIDRNKWKHSPTVNNQCLLCHQQSVQPMRIGIPLGKIDDTCFVCHNSLKESQSKEHRHGPLVAGCTLCHNPHGDEYRYYLWADGAMDICVTCHSDKRKLVDGDNPVPYLHGIIKGAGCVICHNPHASDERFMLRRSVNQLCLGCHQENLDLRIGHPVARHPISGPSEKRRPGRKLTCVGCHDPHGSSFQYLLVQTKQGGRLCRGCHRR